MTLNHHFYENLASALHLGCNVDSSCCLWLNVCHNGIIQTASCWMDIQYCTSHMIKILRTGKLSNKLKKNQCKVLSCIFAHGSDLKSIILHFPNKQNILPVVLVYSAWRNLHLCDIFFRLVGCGHVLPEHWQIMENWRLPAKICTFPDAAIWNYCDSPQSCFVAVHKELEVFVFVFFASVFLAYSQGDIFFGCNHKGQIITWPLWSFAVPRKKVTPVVPPLLFWRRHVYAVSCTDSSLVLISFPMTLSRIAVFIQTL